MRKRSASTAGRARTPRRFALAAWLGLGLGLLIAACSNEQAAPPPGPEASPLLYEVTGPEGAVEGWLLGTIHALPEGTRWRTPATQRVIAQADYLVVEISAPGDAAAREAFMALSSSTGLPPLTERIGPQWRSQLGKLAEAAGTSLDAFATTETWAAALILAQATRPGDPANGVDRALIADFADREVRELEGAARQLRIFDELAPADQRALLESVIEDFGDGIDQAGELRTAWLTGDAARIEQATRTGMMADPELREAILVARNRAWAVQVGKVLGDPERPLIAVGAAHLVGPEGLAALLEAQGFDTRPLNPASAQPPVR